ncbi:MAG: cysteine desulfurase [Candidatus Micrarchaeota archaeon]|nr:cysteine desulfurase [Candidatus Micrarchaeota archaeon]
MKRYYFDNAATTKMDNDVLEAMLPYFGDKYAVATSIFSYTPGLEARDAIEKARKVIADKINAKADEIIFTSGGTESNNTAVLGIARKNGEKKKHIITTEIEHISVSRALEDLKDEGFEIEKISPDSEGIINPEKLRKLIRDDTLMVIVQHANDEIGTLQDIGKIGKICSEKKVFLHVDACQSFTRIPIDVEKMHATSMSFSAHKIHGPKGVGALYLRKGTKIKKIMNGGFNEFDMRPGTENIAGIIGFAKAVQIAKDEDCKKMKELRDYMIERITKEIPHTKINGPLGNMRLCNNVNISFHYVEGESIVLRLDMKGICASTGSACFSRSLEMSPVMKAIGCDHELAHGSMRFTLSKFTTKEEIDYAVDNLKEIVADLRKISPLGK